MINDPMKNIELFNAHQEDSRKRTEFLAKSVFLISGAALTLSINLFLGKDAPSLTAALVTLLRSAWLALFVSILGYILVMSVMLIRDYRFGERWRKLINGHQLDTSGTPDWLDALMWVLGIVSILSLVYGMGALAWVSSSLIGAK